MLAETISELFARLMADAALPAEHRRLNELLALQTEVLVRRLALGHAGAAAQSHIDPVMLGRFRDYRNAVDQQYRHWHHVAPYALHLACSTRA